MVTTHRASVVLKTSHAQPQTSNMKLLIVIGLALVVAVAAAPVEPEPTKILRSDYEQKPDGGYSIYVETDDGTVRQEEGTPKEVLDEENKPHTVVVVRGSYKYTAPDGNTVEITYTADENGFQPLGDSIPKVA